MSSETEGAHLTASEREEYERLRAVIAAIPDKPYTGNPHWYAQRDLAPQSKAFVGFSLLSMFGGLGLFILGQQPQYESQKPELTVLALILFLALPPLIIAYMGWMRRMERERLASLKASMGALSIFLYNSEYQRKERAEAERRRESEQIWRARKAWRDVPYL